MCENWLEAVNILKYTDEAILENNISDICAAMGGIKQIIYHFIMNNKTTDNVLLNLSKTLKNIKQQNINIDNNQNEIKSDLLPHIHIGTLGTWNRTVFYCSCV